MGMDSQNLPTVNDAPRAEAAHWTPRRSEIRDWLRLKAPSLAELYEGAVEMTFRHHPPGWTRFVCHAVREIGNRLPDVIAERMGGERLDYKNRLDEIVLRWEDAGLAVDGSRLGLLDPAAGGIPNSPNVVLPAALVDTFARLVHDHKMTREKPEESAGRLFESIAPENRRLRSTLRPILRKWLEVKGWFEARVHDTTRSPDTSFDAKEVRTQFELFETALSVFAREFFATDRDLDEILEEANS